MPWGDRTGPFGLGPMTGRAAGYCAGYDMPGCMNPGRGGGFFGFGRHGFWGRGSGAGRGWRHRYFATGLQGWAGYAQGPRWPGAPGAQAAWTSEQQMEVLREQSRFLEKSLDDVRKRLEELESTVEAK